MMQLNEMKAHGKRVMGLSIDVGLGFLYSIGEDGRFKITDINVKEPIYDEPVSNTGLKCLVHDKDNQRFFIGDGEGFVYIYSIKNHPPELLAKIQS